MDSSVIVLDSDDEDSAVQEIVKTFNEEVKPAIKRAASNEINESNDCPLSKKAKRIKPTRVGDVEKRSSKNEIKITCDLKTENLIDTATDNSELSKDLVEATQPEAENGTQEILEEIVENSEAGPSTSKETVPKNEISQELNELIEACRSAESSADMKKVIKKKLLKYYHSVHPDYVKSKNFLKSLKEITNEIRKEPHLVYTKLKVILDELDSRRKSKASVITSEDSVEMKGTGDETKDSYLKKLYKALVKLKRHIADLEVAEVDWDDDEDSSYIKKVRYEKRACEIYKKICELTGESADAHRIVKKPIKFKGTDFPAFNAKLKKLVNKKKSFPNYLDVLKLLDYCNKTHNFGLTNDQLKPYAQDAFEKLGKALQKRRKDDFYESAVSYVGKTKDPAKDDPELRAQLEKNKKFYAKYDDIINEFADKEHTANSDDAEEVSSTSKNEQPLEEEPKELADESTSQDKLLDLPKVTCDKNGATITSFDDDDLVIIS